ncbi:MAG: polysaccharide biosynthesis protein [Rubellimicrobium sp.]|nr:polysaccharide biosynthesis protein [Rubellimicrobium sp.]
MKYITSLPRRAKQAIIIAADTVLVPLALATSLVLQQNGLPAYGGLTGNWPAILLLMMVSVLLAIVLGIHRIQLKAYENWAIALTAIHAATLAIVTAALDELAGYGTNFTTFIIFALVYFLMVYSVRVSMLHILLAIYRSGREQVRVLIYGAGLTGQQLAAALKTDDTIKAVAFVDDSKALQGTLVHGLYVHSPVVIAALARNKAVRRVLLAMPSLPRARLAQITRRIEEMDLEVQTLPSFAQLAGSGPELVDQLAPVVAGQFLGRVPLDSELPGGAHSYRDRSVLISGAGGSIGSELCRQILTCNPRRIVLFEQSEPALYTIEMEMRALVGKQPGTQIVAVLGSVCDGAFVRRTLDRHEVEIVLHAAAYKHVPIVEKNPVSGFANNVLGTQTLAVAAGERGVRRFILISTDKAVRPKNLMGASKRMAELVVQDLASRSNAAGGGTIFSMVRFGNVIGSSGSVVPLFQSQIVRGGPVTLTHREVTRYFMTIPEAARLVLVSGSIAAGGDVFVLDMGDPVPIYNLARQMIEASGHTVRDEANPDGDIEIVLTGLRPGEKLHEELLIGSGQITTPHPKIMQAREGHLSEIEVAALLKSIRAAVAEADGDAIRQIVTRWAEGERAAVVRGGS